MAYNRGYVFKDGNPIPDDDLKGDPFNSAPGSSPLTQTNVLHTSTSRGSRLNTPTSSTSASNAPTESHALAESDHEEKGAVQLGHDEAEAKDLGWHEDPQNVPAPLIGGLPNEELWLLVRRFNKVIKSPGAVAMSP